MQICKHCDATKRLKRSDKPSDKSSTISTREVSGFEMRPPFSARMLHMRYATLSVRLYHQQQSETMSLKYESVLEIALKFAI